MKKSWINKCIIKSAGLFITFILMMLSEACIGGIAVYAQATGGFSIHAVIPDNQVDTKQTYFDLRMKPGDEQMVQVVITNSRTEEFEAEVRLNTASTGRNGLIVYTEPDVRDEIMKVAVTDVAVLQSQKVTVPALGSESVMVNIKMPEEPFDGVILGGIAVTDNKAKDDIQAAQGVSLNNTITYVIALKISENDNETKPDFDLTVITPSLINYRTSVVATLQNKAARIIKGMEIEAQIFNKGSDTVLHELQLSEAEMAPLSKGEFVIDWENQPLKQGVYRLKMTADYNGETWEWDEEFIIAAEADGLNNVAVGLENDNKLLYIVVGIILLLIVWIIAYQTGRRRKNVEG